MITNIHEGVPPTTWTLRIIVEIYYYLEYIYEGVLATSGSQIIIISCHKHQLLVQLELPRIS